jgi:PleD family two-component response regulator
LVAASNRPSASAAALFFAPGGAAQGVFFSTCAVLKLSPGAVDGDGRGSEIVRTLLVEDSKPIRRENERALVKAGYEVVCAVDGESALRFARDMKPDLTLLDMISAQVERTGSAAA